MKILAAIIPLLFATLACSNDGALSPQGCIDSAEIAEVTAFEIKRVGLMPVGCGAPGVKGGRSPDSDFVVDLASGRLVFQVPATCETDAHAGETVLDEGQRAQVRAALVGLTLIEPYPSCQVDGGDGIVILQGCGGGTREYLRDGIACGTQIPPLVVSTKSFNDLHDLLLTIAQGG